MQKNGEKWTNVKNPEQKLTFKKRDMRKMRLHFQNNDKDDYNNNYNNNSYNNYNGHQSGNTVLSSLTSSEH